jgi:glycosyltransferase involved in cell wall biosynthesis
MKKTIVLLPTFNERWAIEDILYKLKLLEGVRPFVVDDNSPDGTADLAAFSIGNENVLRRKSRRGLGSAYRAGLAMVQMFVGEIERVVFMDADGSHHVLDLVTSLFDSDAEFVVGSRYVKGSKIIGWSSWRRWLSLWGNRYARKVSGCPIQDMTTGFMVFDINLLARMNMRNCRSNGYAFLAQIKVEALRVGATWQEAPITFLERQTGKSKFNLPVLLEGLVMPWRLRRYVSMKGANSSAGISKLHALASRAERIVGGTRNM